MKQQDLQLVRYAQSPCFSTGKPQPGRLKRSPEAAAAYEAEVLRYQRERQLAIMRRTRKQSQTENTLS